MGVGKAKGKQARKWADGTLSKDELATLDYSQSTDGGNAASAMASDAFNQDEIRALSGRLASDLADVEVPSDEENGLEDEEEEEEEVARPTNAQASSGAFFDLWNAILAVLVFRCTANIVVRLNWGHRMLKMFDFVSFLL